LFREKEIGGVLMEDHVVCEEWVMESDCEAVDARRKMGRKVGGRRTKLLASC